MYTTTHYIECIHRELNKRRDTYPRIVTRKQKEWRDQGENVEQNTIELTTTQRIQFELLAEYKSMLITGNKLHHAILVPIFRELQRELRMRRQLYPRWVRFGRMEQEVAFTELECWNAMVMDFYKKHLPNEPWRKPAIRKIKTADNATY